MEEDTEDQVLGAAMKAWHDLIFELDQNYIGSYHIESDLTLNVVTEEEEEKDNWLGMKMASTAEPFSSFPGDPLVIRVFLLRRRFSWI